jgi:alkyl hydroperoxide reductase subunit AhpC
LVDFDTKAGALASLGIKVVGASVDSGDDARSLASGLRLGFVKTIHSVDAQMATDALGVVSSIRQDVRIMHAAGFLLDPEGNVNTSVISSGPNGRFVPAEMMQKVAFEQARRG